MNPRPTPDTPSRATVRSSARARLTRRRWAGGLLAVGLVGCAGLLGPRTVVVSDAELSQRLATRFPIERRWLEVLDLRLSNPRVRSDAAAGRLRVELEVRLGQRLIGDRRLGARLVLSGRPRYEATDHSIRITEVGVDAVRIDQGADQSLLGAEAAWPSALLAQVLEDRTVYQLSARQLADIDRQGLVLRSLAVAPGGVALTFDPS